MINMNRSYPIEPHPTWDIHDPSKQKEFCDCPRKYFWRYVLGLVSDAPNNHLVFGESFHRAMAYLLQTDYSVNSIQTAYNEHFLPYYRSHFPRSTDELFGAKTPSAALVALSEYAQKYSDDLSRFKVLHVEVAGVAPISSNRQLHFRIDAIVADSRGIYTLEHKTGSGVTRFWTDQWDLDLQPSTYTHALRCAYPNENVRGVMINGIHFKKLKAGPRIDLIRIPIWKNNDQLAAWLYTTNAIMDEIEYNFELLSHSSDSDNVLSCFRQNPGACTKYFGCPYHDFCGAWPNPLQKLDQIPMGFKTEFWDPSEKESQYQLELK